MAAPGVCDLGQTVKDPETARSYFKKAGNGHYRIQDVPSAVRR